MDKVVDIHAIKEQLKANVEKLSRGNNDDLYYLCMLDNIVTSYLKNKNAASTDQSISCI